MTRGRSIVCVACAGIGLVALAGCVHPFVRTAREFRAALDADDFAAARAMMTDNPRTWYDGREGEGFAWVLGTPGRWHEWDTEFNGVSERGAWVAGERSVSAVAVETNDYFELIGRDPSPWLHTYFIDDDGLIEGQMISPVPAERDPTRGERNPGRGDEFDAWYRESYPEEYEHVRPDGRLDPTGDRAAITRKRLVEWREAVGLTSTGRRGTAR